MIVKMIIILFLAIILFCLISALYSLVSHKDQSSLSVVKALTWRIALSLILFILLFVAFLMGWIKPHGIG